MMIIQIQGFECEIDRDLAIAIGVIAPALYAFVRWALPPRRRK